MIAFSLSVPPKIPSLYFVYQLLNCVRVIDSLLMDPWLSKTYSWQYNKYWNLLHIGTPFLLSFCCGEDGIFSHDILLCELSVWA